LGYTMEFRKKRCRKFILNDEDYNSFSGWFI